MLRFYQPPRQASGRNAPVPRVDESFGPTITTVPVRTRVRISSKIQDYLESV